MVEITKRKVSKIRHEYRISSPATSRDMYELMAMVDLDMKAAGRDTSYDDAFHVQARDDEILAYWDEDQVVGT